MDSFTVTFSHSKSLQPTVAIKDSIDIAGYATQLGSRACEAAMPAEKNATVVSRLLEAGYTLVGKTVMHELAYGMTGVNAFSGTPINPTFPDLIPGGSSSGSATAVAGGEVDIAIGSDTGGSVRLPAACCGICGFKPTFDFVSREGVWPSQSSLDCVGVFAKSVQQITEAMCAIAPDFSLTALTKNHFHLGWLCVDADKVILDTVKQALSRCGNFSLSLIELPAFDDAFAAAMTIINRETWLASKAFYATGQLGKDVATRLEKASHTSDAAVAEAEKMRKHFSDQVDAALCRVDALILPTLPHFPMTREQALAGEADLTLSKLVRPFNLSGHPAITLPCPNDTGLPVSIQLVGRKDEDAFLCALAQHLSLIIERTIGAQ